ASDQAVVQPLHGERPVRDDLHHPATSGVDVRVAQDKERACRRAVDQTGRRLEHGDTGTFSADQGAGHVEAVLWKELIEVVTGDAALEFRISLTNQVGVAIAEGAQTGVDLSLPTTFSNDQIQVGFVRNADSHALTI